jgi:hypothetical protein
MGLKSTEGIVGFFDILGYSNFLENNDPELAANTVLTTLTKLPQTTSKQAAELSKGPAKEFIPIIKQIQWLIFSDTILAVLPVSTDEADQVRFKKWTSFIAASVILYRTMIDNGLPLRGSITHGHFVIHKTCFAGRSIIEAYKITHALNISCVVLSHPAQKTLFAVGKKETEGLHHLVYRYLVPLKDGTGEPFLTCAPTLCNNPYRVKTDLRQLVAEAFWGNRKDVAPSVIQKVTNTEMFSRFSQTHADCYFKK